MYTVDTIKEKLSPVFRRYQIDSALLFGSYAKGTATEKSDIDLFVDSNLHGMKFVGLVEAIREAVGGKDVDVLDTSHIEDGSRVSIEIQNTGVKIYG